PGSTGNHQAAVRTHRLNPADSAGRMVNHGATAHPNLTHPAGGIAPDGVAAARLNHPRTRVRRSILRTIAASEPALLRLPALWRWPARLCLPAGLRLRVRLCLPARLHAIWLPLLITLEPLAVVRRGLILLVWLPAGRTAIL